MTYLFRYSLSLILIILVNAKRKDKHHNNHHQNTLKQKRDLSDLHDDPVLTSIFKSDLQEKRKDRSLDDKDDATKKEELLKSMLMSSKGLYRRDTPNFDGALNSSLTLPDSFYSSLAATNPIIGSQIPLPASAKLNPLMNNQVVNPVESDSSAVVPKLFQANYLPLGSQLMANGLPNADLNNAEAASKRDEIAQPLQQSSLHLRKYSPIKDGIRGVVPHTPEYGETVESIQQAQKAFQKSTMPGAYNPMLAMQQQQMMMQFPQNMYSQQVFKKNDIPQPPGAAPVSPTTNDTPEISAPVPVDYAPKQGLNGLLETPPQISDPVPVGMAPMVPSVQTGAEQAAVKSSVTPDASQVQNLDAVYTRPIITDANLDANAARSNVDVAGEECADQYTTCEDFAKNEYCTKYYNLMKIQCRRSCGFCDPNAKPSSDAAQSTVADSDKKDTTPSNTTAPANTTAPVEAKKVTETPKNTTKDSKDAKITKDTKDTKATKKSTTAKPSKSAETHKKTASKKAAVSAKKTDDKKAATKKSTETTKKHVATEAKAKVDKPASKKSKVEKHKEEKKEKDGDKKTTVADMESGSTNEDALDSGSGAFASGDLSGSGSGSGDDEPEEKVEVKEVKTVASKVVQKEAKVAKKSAIPATKKSKKGKPDKVVPAKGDKSNLGEFSFPEKKTVVSTARLTLNSDSDSEGSASGSGSGDDADDTVVEAKKADVKKPKSGGKATAKKSTHGKVPAVTKHLKKSKINIKKTKKADKLSKKAKVTKGKKEKHIITKSKKSDVPEKPKKLTSYPKIDLKLIASALAHYEEAALELAGEYPKAPPSVVEVARSTIPHPSAVTAGQTAAITAPAVAVQNDAALNARTIIPRPHPYEQQGPPLPSFENKKELIIDPLQKYKQNLEIAKLLTDDRNGRSTIPKYLKLSKDVKKGEIEEENVENVADSLPSIQKRFNILGIEPTLIDYYAETGKINPFAQKHKKKEKNVKKSNINANSDPYEYLRNMPAGASMLPIDDPKSRSHIPSDHSYPVFLMKVSPGAQKYIDEPPMRRGEIRHLNAEGVRIDDKTEVGGLPKDVVRKLKGNAAKLRIPEPAKKAEAPKAPAPAAPALNPFVPGGMPMYANPFAPNAQQAMAMMSAASNLQNNLIQAQAQAKANVPAPKRPAPKAAVPRPAAAGRPINQPLSPSAVQQMEQSAITSGLQYAQNEMKINELNKLIAKSKAEMNQPPNMATARSQYPMNPAAQQIPGIQTPFDFARATAPQVNPGLAGEMQVNDLKNKMVNAFFPMKKDGVGFEGSANMKKRENV